MRPSKRGKGAPGARGDRADGHHAVRGDPGGAQGGALGKKNPDLQHYGLKPAQTPAPLTVEQKSVKAAKAKATRAARHTLGPKQKKAIKGQWPPVAAPTAPAADKPSV